MRGAGRAEDGLPRTVESDDDRGRSRQHRLQRQGASGDRGNRAGRPAHLRASPAGGHPRRIPARRLGHACPAQADAAHRVRGHLRRLSAVPPRPHGDELAHELRPAQKRAPRDRSDPPRTRGAAARDSGADLRPHRLPRAGHANRAGVRGLHNGPGRHAAQGHGQEEARRAAKAVRGFFGRNARQRVFKGMRRQAVGDPRPLRAVRFQQIPLGLLRRHFVLDGLPQGQLPGRVHGRALDVEEGQQGQARPLPRRMPQDGHHGSRSRRQRF